MLTKSKQIKKVKMDQQFKAVERAQSNLPKTKVAKKVPTKLKEALKTTNAQYKKYKYITQKVIQLDQEHVVKVIESLKKHHKVQHDQDDRIYLIVTLKTCPNLQEAATIQMYNYYNNSPLPHTLYGQQSTVAFVMKANEIEEFKKKQSMLNKYCQPEIMTLNTFISKKDEQKKFTTGINQMFIDYTLHKQVNKKIFPFHLNKVPFEVKKVYNVNTYEEYIKHIIGSTFTMITNRNEQSIPVGRVSMPTKHLSDNVTFALYEFVAQLLNQSRSNSVTQITMKTHKSIELLIYEQQ